MDMRPVLHIAGILLSVLALSMLLPLMVELYSGNEGWKVFFLCMVITAFFGGLLVLTTSGLPAKITIRQGFLMIGLSWCFCAVFAALPFWLYNLKLSVADSIFESVSGITTTGSTVMTSLEDVPRGILIWRALLQWLGGIGTIIMALTIFPFLKVGGMQVFQSEFSEGEKALPRAVQLSVSIGAIYAGLTLICMTAYKLAGMSSFDAASHAMTTISTGGFSTHDDSFSAFSSVAPMIVAIIFMIAGSIPFVLYLKALKGNTRALLQDTQLRWLLSIIMISAIALSLFLLQNENDSSQNSTPLHALFTAVSIISGTGFFIGNYNMWGFFPISLLFFMMALGACAGSTTGGIKIFRYQILYSVVDCHIRKLMYPSGLFIPQYNKKTVPEGVPTAVMGYFFLYAVCFCLLALALSMTNLDFMTASSAAATALANVGPGLGEVIGPGMTFKALPDSAKWILSAGMLLGRLEIYPILVMLSPHFWSR